MSVRIPPQRASLGLALGFVGTVIFGATVPLTRLAVAEFDPWFVTFGRAALAGIAAVAVLLALRRPLPSRAQALRLAVAAVLLCLGFAGLMALAMRTLPAAHGGVVIGLLPLATAATSALLNGERPSPMFWATSLLGTLLVIAYALREGGGTWTSGDLLLIAAVVSSALGYVMSGNLSRQMPGWEVISWIVVLALPVTLPASILTAPRDLAAITPGAWACLAYLGLMSMYVGFFAWNAGLALGGIARVSQIQLLQPFVTLAISAVLLGEHIDTLTILFVLAIVGCVFLNRKSRVEATARRMPIPAPEPLARR